jgi:hypothetical protein
MQGGKNSLERGMRQSYRLVASGSNRQIAVLGRGRDGMNGYEMSAPALGLWWCVGAALSAALAVDADATDNRALAFVTVALCAALIVYAGAAIAGHRRAADASAEGSSTSRQ